MQKRDADERREIVVIVSMSNEAEIPHETDLTNIVMEGSKGLNCREVRVLLNHSSFPGAGPRVILLVLTISSTLAFTQQQTLTSV